MGNVRVCRVAACKSLTGSFREDHAHKCLLCRGLIECVGEEAKCCEIQGVKVVCEGCARIDGSS